MAQKGRVVLRNSDATMQLEPQRMWLRGKSFDVRAVGAVFGVAVRA